jgi:hypothetical protein
MTSPFSREGRLSSRLTPPADRLTRPLADRQRIERKLGAVGMATVSVAGSSS